MVNTIGGVSLGTVNVIRSSLNQVFSHDSTPTKTSDLAVLTSIEGNLRNITVTGTISASTIALLKTAVEAIEAKMDGNQDDSMVLNLDVAGTTFLVKDVKILDFTWTYDDGVYAVVDYTLKLLEGV